MGFLAGLYAHGDDALYNSFEEAYETLKEVSPELLASFEEELKESQSRTFLYGDKLVSVIDTVELDKTATRTLILNRRPHLVQTAVKVGSPGAPYTYGGPAPLSETHLGGLALSLLMSPQARPHCAIIGAGGCTLANTLTSFDLSSLTAVEPCASVRSAALLFFGADTSKFSLVGGDGLSYLGHQPPSSLDLLIIDADDGNIPPKSMSTKEFFLDSVAPVLSADGVVAINAIGTSEELSALEATVRDSFPNHYTASIPAPPEAEVDSDRHTLLFVTPSPIVPHELEALLEKRPVVSEPQAWMNSIHQSIT